MNIIIKLNKQERKVNKMTNIPDEQKRKIYKKAFGKEYDNKNRKQLPLPLDIAFQVANYKLKKENIKEGK